MLHRASAVLWMYVSINQMLQKAEEGDLSINTRQHGRHSSLHDGSVVVWLRAACGSRSLHSTYYSGASGM